MRMTTKMYC